MSAIQLSFSLKVSPGVQTVHLLGSWDTYQGHLPLSVEKESSRSTSWKGTFRFQPTTLQPGQRFWYYYMLDGYRRVHNPGEGFVVEPTSGQKMNILDVPRTKASPSSPTSSSSSARHAKDGSSRHAKRASNLSVDIPKGRPLSMSQIKAPKPMSPHATRHILEGDFDERAFSERFAAAAIYDEDEADDLMVTGYGGSGPSPVSSTGSDLSSRSSSSSPSSSLSSRSSRSRSSGYSTPSSECGPCTCERYGITRKGERVRIDCGGARCGCASDDDSICSSEDDGKAARSSRRHGIVVR